MRVYLAGYMSADPRTRQWRIDAAKKLAVVTDYDGETHRVTTVDPFRGKQKLSKTGLASSMPLELVVVRDEMDVRGCDIVLLNTICMNETTRPSIGSWSEFGLAAMGLKMPVIMISEDPNIKNHPFPFGLATMIVKTLDEAVDAIRWLLPVKDLTS